MNEHVKPNPAASASGRPPAARHPQRRGHPVGAAAEEARQDVGRAHRYAENLLVRIEAADGTVGWGEAASAPTMTGDTQGGLIAAVRDTWRRC